MRTSVLLPVQFSFKLESILLISHSRSRRIPSILNLSSKVFLIHWSLLLLPTWMIASSHNNAFQHLICGLFENVRYTVFPWWFKQSWHTLEKTLIYVPHKQLIIKWCDGFSALDDRMVRIYSHSRMLYKWITVCCINELHPYFCFVWNITKIGKAGITFHWIGLHSFALLCCAVLCCAPCPMQWPVESSSAI